mmetsp:Transcript_49920/g.95389  ORF Transcript_49920/g.95389 Transcript_49920/m.95389 type:complete len:216 (-) Transcript_49920:335-982(-)
MPSHGPFRRALECLAGGHGRESVVELSQPDQGQQVGGHAREELVEAAGVRGAQVGALVHLHQPGPHARVHHEVEPPQLKHVGVPVGVLGGHAVHSGLVEPQQLHDVVAQVPGQGRVLLLSDERSQGVLGRHAAHEVVRNGVAQVPRRDVVVPNHVGVLVGVRTRPSVLLHAEPQQEVVIDVHLQRPEGRHRHVNPEVPPPPVHQVRVPNVLLQEN